MFATIAFVFFGISYFMRAGYTADASFADYMMPLLVQGVAMSTFFVALLSILLEGVPDSQIPAASRSEEHTSELQSLMRISYAVFCLKKKKTANSYTSLNDHVLQSHTHL